MGGVRTGNFARGKFRPDPRLTPPLQETHAIGQGALAAELANPLLGGLLRYPDAIRAHAEELAQLTLSDRDSAALLDAMIDAAFCQERLDTQGLLTILEPMTVYNKALTLLRANGMHFSFNRNLDGFRGADEAVGALKTQARRDLDEVIGAALAWPEVDAALAAATARFMADMTEEGFAEQQRLTNAKQQLVARLAALREAGAAQ